MLLIRVERLYKKEEYTIGKMYVNGKYFCDTLEDKDRGLDSSFPLSKLKRMKVYGKTAIPTGTYDVRVYFWAKYRKNYPLLLDVPAYTGILIHGMTNHTQSLGCIGVGENKERGKIQNSEKYVRKLTKMCEEAEKNNEDIKITIR